jgi:hypothetical protein
MDDQDTHPLFDLGHLYMTHGATEALSMPQALDLILRHVSGDWGNVDQEDSATNDDAVRHGGRIVSEYSAPSGSRVWIITEAGRHATTVLLPSEY